MKQVVKIVFFVCAVFVCSTNHAFSQAKGNTSKLAVPPAPPQPPAGDNIYDVVDENPEPPGGMQGYQKFLSDSIKYPEDARKAGAQGTVYIALIVEKDGSINSAKIQADRPGHGCGPEALRVIQKMGKWKPAKMNGQPVRARYVVPVKFVLS